MDTSSHPNKKPQDVQYHARLYAYSLLAKRVPTAAINTCTLFALSIPSACQWAQVSDDIGFVQDSIAHRYMASVRANCTVNGKRKTYTLSNYIGDTARFTGCADTSATTTTKQQRAGIGDACQCNQDASSSLQKRRQLKDAALKEAETEVPYFNRRTCKIVSLTQLCRNVQTCVCPGSMIAKDTGSFYGKGVVQCGRGQAVVRHPIVIDENFDAEGSL